MTANYSTTNRPPHADSARTHCALEGLGVPASVHLGVLRFFVDYKDRITLIDIATVLEIMLSARSN